MSVEADAAKVKRFNRSVSITGLVLIAVVALGYGYVLHTGDAQSWLKSIQNLGGSGVLIGIAVQTLVNMFPLPGEFTSLVLMEIYGPVWGGIYSWIGGVTGAVGGFYLAKWVARPFFSQLASPILHKVDELVAKREVAGLLALRFAPFVPYHLANYAAGLLKVKLWSFVWTAGVGILPYTVAMSGIYAGVRKGSMGWGIAGGTIFVLLAGIGWYARRRKQRQTICQKEMDLR